MNYYTSCGNIPIFNVDKIMTEKDMSYMVVGYDEFEKIQLEDEEKARSNWEIIFNEYIELSDDNSSAMYYMVLSEINYLQTRKFVVSKLLGQLIKFIDNDEVTKIYIDALKEFKFKVDPKKDLTSEVKRMVRQLRATDNKINLKKAELKQYEGNGKSMSLTKQIVKVEQALGRNAINPKTTTAEKWLMLLDELKTKKNG